MSSSHPGLVTLEPRHGPVLSIARCRPQVRVSVFLWRRAEAEWIGWEAWAKKLSGFAPISEVMTPSQRCLLGWPALGSGYWRREEAVEGAVARYGEGMRVYQPGRAAL